MVISKTPFRISFFGGGTDLPKWYNENGGSVISTSINKHCFVFGKRIPPFLDYNYRIVYSQQELLKNLEDIDHPAVRESLRFMNWGDKKIEIIHSGDLPSRSGLGSSSSFTVGILNMLYALEGKRADKNTLAKNAIHVEQEMIKEAVGSQDQIATAYGGFNHIRFYKGGFEVKPFFNESFLKEFNKHLLLFFTGTTRNSFEIERVKIDSIGQKQTHYKELQEITEYALECFEAERLNKIGKLLHETWLIKKNLCDKISNIEIDNIYQIAMEAGAIGGKVLGSGGGGFMLFFAEPSQQPAIIEALKKLMLVPFEFEKNGSEIIYYNGGNV